MTSGLDPRLIRAFRTARMVLVGDESDGFAEPRSDQGNDRIEEHLEQGILGACKDPSMGSQVYRLTRVPDVPGYLYIA